MTTQTASTSPSLTPTPPEAEPLDLPPSLDEVRSRINALTTKLTDATIKLRYARLACRQYEREIVRLKGDIACLMQSVPDDRRSSDRPNRIRAALARVFEEAAGRPLLTREIVRHPEVQKALEDVVTRAHKATLVNNALRTMKTVRRVDRGVWQGIPTREAVQ